MYNILYSINSWSHELATKVPRRDMKKFEVGKRPRLELWPNPADRKAFLQNLFHTRLFRLGLPAEVKLLSQTRVQSEEFQTV